jgi:hypothetical protein
MSTQRKPPTGTSGAGTGPEPPVGDPWPEEEPTVVELTDADVQEFDTPVTMPRCQECGRVVFLDAFTDAASIVAMGLFSADRCVRSRDGRMRWCGEAWELRYRPPR